MSSNAYPTSDVLLYGYIVPQSLLIAQGEAMIKQDRDQIKKTFGRFPPHVVTPQLTRLDALALAARQMFCDANLYVTPPAPVPPAAKKVDKKDKKTT